MSRTRGNELCAEADCGKLATVRGLCQPHYYRMLAHEKHERGEQCLWPRCQEPPRSGGFCASHYHRVKHDVGLEDMLAPHLRAPRCSKNDCDNPKYAKGLCRKHYVRPDPFSPDRSPHVKVNRHRLRVAAMCAGLTMGQIASAAGVSHQAMSNHLAQSQLPAHYLDPICAAVGMSKEWLQIDSPPRLLDDSGEGKS